MIASHREWAQSFLEFSSQRKCIKRRTLHCAERGGEDDAFFGPWLVEGWVCCYFLLFLGVGCWGFLVLGWGGGGYGVENKSGTAKTNRQKGLKEDIPILAFGEWGPFCKNEWRLKGWKGTRWGGLDAE